VQFFEGTGLDRNCRPSLWAEFGDRHEGRCREIDKRPG
jgi:hypothetical protein